MKDLTGNADTGRFKVLDSANLAHPPSLNIRPAGRGRGFLGALAVTILAAGLAEAATLPDGYVTLGSGMGVASARVLANGSLELTLADGSVRIYGSSDFVLLEGGEIALSGEVAAELVALAVSGSSVAGAAAAGLLGAAAAAAAGGDDAVPAVRATVDGDISGGVTEDDAATLEGSGTLTVTDPDTGQAVFVAQGSAAGTYGAFTLGTDGVWTYAADNTQTAIQSLANGATLTDSFTAVTADGTTQVVTVTITGVNDGAVELPEVSLDADMRGFVINGVSANDQSGVSVSSAGDVNGDGFDDLIVGAWVDDPNGSSSGAVCVRYRFVVSLTGSARLKSGFAF